MRFHERLKDEERGFTLIELLVVVLIIAILAAIAVPVFLNQRRKGWVAQQQSTLKDAATASESFATGNNGSYLGLTLEKLAEEGYVEPSWATVTVGSATASAYCIQSVHAQDAGDWDTARFRSADGEPSQGACA